MRLFMLALLASLAIGPVFAQQPPADPDMLAVRLQDAASVIEAREKQIVQMARQLQNERAYWASYVAGLTAPADPKWW